MQIGNTRRFRPCLETLEIRALLNAGAPDPTFAGGVVTTQLPGQDTAVAVAIQPDGKIVAASTSGDIVRYNNDGTLDSTFGNQGIVLGQTGELINAIAITANGNLIASGSANKEAVVFEFNSNGTPNTPFGVNGILTLATDPDSGTAGLQLQPDGKIVGLVEDSTSLKSVFRLNPDGTPDSSFVSATFATSFGGSYTMALAPNGQIIVGGFDKQIGKVTIYRLNPDGSQDTALVGGNGTLQLPNLTVGAPSMLTADAQNRIVILANENNQYEQVLERINVNGTPDVTFGGQAGAGIGQVMVSPDSEGGSVAVGLTSCLVQPDGRLVVAGIRNELFSVQYFSAVYVARYNPNGTLDTTFGDNGATMTGPALSGAAAAVLQTDGKIVLVGHEYTGSGISGDLGNSLFLTARLLGDTPSGDANQRFVSQVYLDLLQRPADPAGLAGWSALLNSGQQTSQQVALGIESSQEYHNLVVNNLYGEYLQRSADPVGLSAWSAFLAGGGTIDQLRAMLLGSAEYFADSGSTNSGFVAAAYRDVLARPPDSGGAQFWQGALSSGASPLAVAGALIDSREAITDELTTLYFWLLHRAPDASGLQSFSQALEQGVPVDSVVAAIVGSSEYMSTR
jgi:uncharacterized delta-60 repeat protein